MMKKLDGVGFFNAIYHFIGGTFAGKAKYLQNYLKFGGFMLNFHYCEVICLGIL